MWTLIQPVLMDTCTWRHFTNRHLYIASCSTQTDSCIKLFPAYSTNT